MSLCYFQAIFARVEEELTCSCYLFASSFAVASEEKRDFDPRGIRAYETSNCQGYTYVEAAIQPGTDGFYNLTKNVNKLKTQNHVKITICL